MLAYLESKYKKQFVVDSITYSNQTSDYQLSFHLRDNDQIHFFAYRNTVTQNMGDTFLLHYWDDEVTADFKQMFIEVFPENPPLLYTPPGLMHFVKGQQQQLIDEGYPSFPQIVLRYPSKFTMSLQIEIEIGALHLSEEQYQERIFQIINYYRDRGITLEGMRVRLLENRKDNIAKFILDIINQTEFNKVTQINDLKSHWRKVNANK